MVSEKMFLPTFILPIRYSIILILIENPKIVIRRHKKVRRKKPQRKSILENVEI